MRRFWALASVLGLLAMVTFGTWGCLAAGVGDRGAATSGVIAIGGGLVMVIGLIGRGDGAKTIARARRILGGVGLCVAPVAAALAILNFGTASTFTGLVFLLVTVVALALWAQAIAVQAALPFRVAAAWLAIAVLGAVVAFPIALVIDAVVAAAVTALGGDSGTARLLGSAAALALLGWILGIWGWQRPDRRALPGALGRAVLGRALPADVGLLLAGPSGIIRGRRTATPAEDERSATLAALDRGLGPAGDATDRSGSTDDDARES